MDVAVFQQQKIFNRQQARFDPKIINSAFCQKDYNLLGKIKVSSESNTKYSKICVVRESPSK